MPSGARRSEDNRRLLEIENPRLAAEGLWAHATTSPEIGGLLIASMQCSDILGDDKLWQVRTQRPTYVPGWGCVRWDALETTGVLLARPCAYLGSCSRTHTARTQAASGEQLPSVHFV